MEELIEKKPRALLVCAVTQNYEMASFEELEELVDTVGAEVVLTTTQNRQNIDKGTCVGSGKVLEIKEIVENNDIDIVVFDNKLSPGQQRNIEDIVEVKVIDRTGIILQIFADRARSNEGKAQVELAQLRYMLPRLKGKGASLSKQAGGIGSRGPGESKLETDRRHILHKLTLLKQKIEEIQQNRQQLRKKRKKNNIPVVSIAGYTNAGKSTLLNKLTNAEVLAKDMLFATLDSTTRKFKLPCGKDILLSDTVGFIRNLPHDLVVSFKSTFEEIIDSDLVLLTVDISSSDFLNHISVVEKTLEEIGYTGKIIYVYNKSDKIHDEKIIYFPSKTSVYISAKNEIGFDKLVELIEDSINDLQKCVLILPYDKFSIYNDLKNQKKVLEETFDDTNFTVTCNLNERERSCYSEFIKKD